MVWKRIKEFLKRRQQPHKPPEVEVTRQSSLQDDYEQTMMAIAFAEAGAAEQAREVLRQRGKRKILVVTQADTFTEPVMEYATLLAERMGYELIALNVGGAASDKAASGYRQHMQEEFQRRAAAAFAALEQKAAARNIPVTHVVRFGDVGAAVAAIHREYRRVELLITDSRAREDEVAARVNLPVFSLKSHQ
uniref:UspA domain-containing protein n=1 Tax=Desulfobacca acetoxidans TaxID=60893 RepID=A0A7V6A6C2_9BACT